MEDMAVSGRLWQVTATGAGPGVVFPAVRAASFSHGRSSCEKEGPGAVSGSQVALCRSEPQKDGFYLFLIFPLTPFLLE